MNPLNKKTSFGAFFFIPHLLLLFPSSSPHLATLALLFAYRVGLAV